ncbi:MAG: DNA repair protein RecO [Candidatus Omnitrophota bacterium]|nr:DNA repair protein RecO [Candidatus Omnitrophota bacterium]
MAVRKTEAIVLRTRDFRETSLVVNFYTRDFGKITGLIKGVRATRKGYTTYPQLFSHNEIVFYEKVHSGLHVVSQCELKDFFPAIRENLRKTAYASYFIELIDETSLERDKNLAVFNLLLGSLCLLSAGDIKKVVHIFEIKLLELLGLMPVLGQCVYCNSSLKEKVRFSPALGGLLCKQCFLKDTKAIDILKGTIASLGYLSKVSLEQAIRLKLTWKVEENLSRILKAFLDFHLDRPLKSVEFLRKIEESKSWQKVS